MRDRGVRSTRGPGLFGDTSEAYAGAIEVFPAVSLPRFLVQGLKLSFTGYNACVYLRRLRVSCSLAMASALDRLC